ncbi:MAG: hypothetical protein ABI784_09950 [Ginsengibacter sp.]
MTEEIDKKYKRQIIEKVESNFPYKNLSLVNNLSIIKTIIFIFLFGAVIVAFLPPRFGTNKFTFPNSWNDYFERLKNVLFLYIIIVVFVLVSAISLKIRTFIDRQCGYTKFGVFKVTAVWNLWVKKIVFLNNLHFLSLRQKDFGFDEIKVGQVLQIERTATHKFIDFKITRQ